MDNLEKNKYTENFSNIVDLPSMISNSAEQLMDILPEITLNESPIEVCDPFIYNYDYLQNISDFAVIPEDSEELYPVVLNSGQRVTVKIEDIKAFTDVVNNLCKPDARYDHDFISFNELTKQLDVSNLRILENKIVEVQPKIVSYDIASQVLQQQSEAEILANTADTAFIDVSDDELFVGVNKITVQAKPLVSGIKLELTPDNAELSFIANSNEEAEMTVTLDSVLKQNSPKFSGFSDLTLIGIKLNESTNLTITNQNSSATFDLTANDTVFGAQAVKINIDAIDRLTATVNASNRGILIDTDNFEKYCQYTKTTSDGMNDLEISSNPIGFKSIILDADLIYNLDERLVKYALLNSTTYNSINKGNISNLIADYNKFNTDKITSPDNIGSFLGFTTISLPEITLVENTISKAVTFNDMVNALREGGNGLTFEIKPNESIQTLNSVTIDDIDVLSTTISLKSSLSSISSTIISSNDPKIVTELKVEVEEIPSTQLVIDQNYILNKYDFNNTKKDKDKSSILFNYNDNDANSVFTSVELELPAPWQPKITSSNLSGIMRQAKSTQASLLINNDGIQQSLDSDVILPIKPTTSLLSDVTLTLPSCRDLTLSSQQLVDLIKDTNHNITIDSSILVLNNTAISSNKADFIDQIKISLPKSTNLTCSKTSVITAINAKSSKLIFKPIAYDANFFGEFTVMIPKGKTFKLDKTKYINAITSNTTNTNSYIFTPDGTLSTGLDNLNDNNKADVITEVSIPQITSTNIKVDCDKIKQCMENGIDFTIATSHSSINKAVDIRAEQDFVNSVNLDLPIVYQKRNNEIFTLGSAVCNITGTTLSIAPPSGYDYIKNIDIQLETTGQEGIDREISTNNNLLSNAIKNNIDDYLIINRDAVVTTKSNKVLYDFEAIPETDGILKYLNSVKIPLPKSCKQEISVDNLFSLLKGSQGSTVTFDSKTTQIITKSNTLIHVNNTNSNADFIDSITLNLPVLTKPNIDITTYADGYSKLEIGSKYVFATPREDGPRKVVQHSNITATEAGLLDTATVILPEFYNVNVTETDIATAIRSNKSILNYSPSSIYFAGDYQINLPRTVSYGLTALDVTNAISGDAYKIIADANGITALYDPADLNNKNVIISNTNSDKVLNRIEINLPICTNLNLNRQLIKELLVNRSNSVTFNPYKPVYNINANSITISDKPGDFYKQVTLALPENRNWTLDKSTIVSWMTNNYSKITSDLSGYTVYNSSNTVAHQQSCTNQNQILSTFTVGLPTTTNASISKACLCDLINNAVGSLSLQPSKTNLVSVNNTSYKISSTTADFYRNVTLALPTAKTLTLSRSNMTTLLRNAYANATYADYEITGQTLSLPNTGSLTTKSTDFLSNVTLKMPSFSTYDITTKSAMDLINLGYNTITYSFTDGIKAKDSANNLTDKSLLSFGSQNILGRLSIELPIPQKTFYFRFTNSTYAGLDIKSSNNNLKGIYRTEGCSVFELGPKFGTYACRYTPNMSDRQANFIDIVLETSRLFAFSKDWILSIHDLHTQTARQTHEFIAQVSRIRIFLDAKQVRFFDKNDSTIKTLALPAYQEDDVLIFDD